uniref:Uncharacterized protein n=1 Tax=Glossina palpalis gambiensis TaxID=67801 RepID=A0A1B0C590_9MUSC
MDNFGEILLNPYTMCRQTKQDAQYLSVKSLTCEELIIRFLNYMEKMRDITGMPNHVGLRAAFQELPSFPFFVVLRGILMKWQLHVFLL